MNGMPLASVLPVALPGHPTERVAALFDAHHDRLYRLARRLAPNAEDALDLVQDTFLKAARSPAAVPLGTTNEEAWLVRVLINIRRDQWRRASVRSRHSQELSRSAATTGSDPEALLIARTTVWRALDALTPRRRAVLVLCELEGLTVPAVATLLGISAITVRWHLANGRRELGRILRRQMGATNENR